MNGHATAEGRSLASLGNLTATRILRLARALDRDPGLQRLQQMKADLRDAELISQVLQPMGDRQKKCG